MVIPTFKEAENIGPMIELLDAVLVNIAWEVVFVDDDSPDETSEVVRALAQKRSNIRILERIGRRGLSSAVVEGILSSSANYIAVMDCDMQHDERLLLTMLDVLKSQPVDIVVGSRYKVGGGIGAWDERRAWMSSLATRFSKLIISDELTDPMSGFFMLTRNAFNSSVRNLSSQGYKILLDILASSNRKLQIKELAYTFRLRRFGESKIDSMVVLEYGFLLIDKQIGRASCRERVLVAV